MVRLRPPSVPVGARWIRTPPSVSFIGLLLFVLTYSNVPFVTSSVHSSSSRNFSSKHTSINMDPVSRRTLLRSETDLATKTLRVAREVDHGIHRSVARRESSSVEFRKLNRVRKHISKNNSQHNSEAPTFPSMNVEQFHLVNTETVNRRERYGAPKNVSTVQARTTVPQPLGSDFENVNVTAQSSLLNRHWVPRVMLDLYEAAQRPGHTSPYGANIVRSFSPLGSVSVLNETLLGDIFGEEDNRGYEGRGRATLTPSITPDTVSYSFPFQLALPKGEHIRNLLLRLHTIVERKHSPAGLERRLRVLATRHPTSASSAGGDSTSRPPRPVEVARKDVYLHNHAWLTLNVRTLLRHLGPPEHVLNVTLVLRIERVFASVGDTGDMALDHTSGIDFQPLLLLYTSQPNLTRKERHQFFHFENRPRRSVHENDWDWDGGEEGEEEEPEPPGRDPGRKGRRAGRRRRAKNTCKRRPLKVDFESIGWQDWVIAPVEYEAYQCSGKCFYPLASHLNPTKHAVIQTLMHSRSSERARRACCVPTLLGPISLLYLEDGVPTFKKEYDDMVALECGCR